MAKNNKKLTKTVKRTTSPFNTDGRPIDPGIAEAVRILWENGVETYESCQGGNGHPSPVPMVRFHGEYGEGMRALGIALSFRLPVRELRRIWSIIDGEPVGPQWEMTFTIPGCGGSKVVHKEDGTATFIWG
jgi:hypothetical protein